MSKGGKAVKYTVDRISSGVSSGLIVVINYFYYNSNTLHKIIKLVRL